MTSRVRGKTPQRKIQSAKIKMKTSIKLKKLLLCIAKFEEKIELQRQFLASNENCEPYSAFSRIDRDQDGFISSMELVYFMRDNGVYDITEADCYYLVKFFDADEDGKLNYPDFLQVILPTNNQNLRSEATQRPNVYISQDDYLTMDVEEELTQLIQLEIQLHQKSEKLKQELESMGDFSEETVYKAIDDWGYGYVDQCNLKNFLKSQKHLATDDECTAIIRRLDLDADSKLNFEEFIKGIKPEEPFSKMLIRERMAKQDEIKKVKKQNKEDQAKGKRTNKKAEQGKQEDTVKEFALDRSYKDVLSTSPLKYRTKLDLYGSPKQQKQAQQQSPTKSQNKSPTTKTAKFLKNSVSSKIINSPSKAYQNKSQEIGRNQQVASKTISYDKGFGNDSFGSPSKFRMSKVPTMAGSQYKTPNKFTSSSRKQDKGFTDSGLGFSIGFDESKFKPSYSYNQEDIQKSLVDIFSQQLDLERNLEKIQVDLSLRTDFNLIDAFRLFDADGQGFIVASTIKEGLKIFDIFAQEDDIQLFMKRYDKDEDGRLKYSEFCDAFLPTDSFHASILAKKPPLHLHQYQLQKEKIFYPETRSLFQSAWQTHIHNERQAEKIRLQLQCSPNFSPYHYFQICDQKGDGVIDKEEIKDLLLQFNYYESEKEICALIDRYDRQRDGRINYSEFVEELTAKTGTI